MINTVRRHINVSRLNAASASSSVAEGDLYQNEMNAGEGEGGKNACEMYGPCQETHWDWIDLDDMNNLADTKGGNINAHIYSNLPPPCRWRVDAMFPSASRVEKSSRCPPGAELIQKCIFASELFTYRCMIMISRLIRDKIRRCRPSFGALEVTCFFPRWPLARQRPRFTANTLIAADTCAPFPPAPSRLSSRHPVRRHTGNRCPRFVLASVAGVLD